MTTVKPTRPWVRLCTRMLAGGGLAFSAFGLAGGIAEATPPPVPGYHWCPGDRWDPAWGNNYNWDWNQCHDWPGPPSQGAPAGWGPWGPPPPWAPPPPPPPAWAPEAHLMWNPTVSQWGFWNNGVWTSV